MHILLPYESYVQSIHCLSDTHLDRQRHEVLQVLDMIRDQGSWYNHPTVGMWRRHVPLLCLYAQQVIVECDARKMKSDRHRAMVMQHVLLNGPPSGPLPFWHKCETLHKLYRMHLQHEDPGFYKHKFLLRTPHINPPHVWPYYRDEWQDEGDTTFRLTRQKRPILVKPVTQATKGTGPGGEQTKLIRTRQRDGTEVYYLLQVTEAAEVLRTGQVELEGTSG